MGRRGRPVAEDGHDGLEAGTALGELGAHGVPEPMGAHGRLTLRGRPARPRRSRCGRRRRTGWRRRRGRIRRYRSTASRIVGAQGSGSGRSLQVGRRGVPTLGDLETWPMLNSSMCTARSLARCVRTKPAPAGVPGETRTAAGIERPPEIEKVLPGADLADLPADGVAVIGGDSGNSPSARLNRSRWRGRPRPGGRCPPRRRPEAARAGRSGRAPPWRGCRARAAARRRAGRYSARG